VRVCPRAARAPDGASHTVQRSLPNYFKWSASVRDPRPRTLPKTCQGAASSSGQTFSKCERLSLSFSFLFPSPSLPLSLALSLALYTGLRGLHGGFVAASASRKEQAAFKILQGTAGTLGFTLAKCTAIRRWSKAGEPTLVKHLNSDPFGSFRGVPVFQDRLLGEAEHLLCKDPLLMGPSSTTANGGHYGVSGQS